MVHLSHSVLATGEPYVPGLSRSAVAERFGIPESDVAKLGSAENPLGASPKAVIAIAGALSAADQYPNWTAESLRTKIAETYGFAPDQVVCGAGETEVISFVLRAYAGEGEKVLMYRPCFPIYHLFAENEGRVPVYVDMGPTLDFNIKAYLEAVSAPDIRVAFLTNPHSPSGKLMTDEEIRAVCEAAGDTLVVLDEAYIHFTETDGGFHLLKDYPNLIVLRTFSKAYGLAGLRVGFGIAALDDLDHLNRTVSLIVEMRGYVAQRLSGLRAFRMVPGSRSNFFLIEVVDPRLDSTVAFEELLSRGVIVKDGSVSFQGLGKRFLRVDVNLQKHMDRLVDALADIERSLG